MRLSLWECGNALTSNLVETKETEIAHTGHNTNQSDQWLPGYWLDISEIPQEKSFLTHSPFLPQVSLNN